MTSTVPQVTQEIRRQVTPTVRWNYGPESVPVDGLHKAGALLHRMWRYDLSGQPFR